METITTLLHLCAMNRDLPVAYNTLVAAATFVSATYHSAQRPDPAMWTLDLALATLWAAADAYMDARTVPLNVIVFLLFLSMEDHAAWHCVSAAKAAIVSRMLAAAAAP